MSTTSVYTLSEVEVATLEEWLVGHDCPKKVPSVLSISFTHTGIGHNINVKCTCGEIKDITDYGCW